MTTSTSQDQSKSSDSLHLSDGGNLHLTDEDSFASSLLKTDQVKTQDILSESGSVNLDDLSHDKGSFRFSDDGSNQPQKNDHASSSEQAHEGGSLTEFEEIERLIKKNTVSDDDSLLSVEEDENDENKDVRTTTQAFDTGYQTKAVHHSSASEDEAHSTSVQSHVTDDELPSTSARSHNQSNFSDLEESVVEDRKASPLRSRRSSSIGGAGDGPSWMRKNSSQELHPPDGSGDTMSKFFEPTASTSFEHDEMTEENEGDDGLVARFNTTENFESLLQQQLEGKYDSESSNEQIPEEILPQDVRQEPQRIPQLPLENLASPKAAQKLSLNRSKRLPPRKATRTTRSPAANRARRANNISNNRKSRPSHNVFTGSSDESSMRSEVSRGELKKRLKEESKTRKNEAEVAEQLQRDYDNLLTKYAEAENTIDALRLGAKINLYADIPPMPEGHQPAFDGIKLHSNRLSSKASSRSGRSNRAGSFSDDDEMDNMTENSLKLPSAASTEFMRVALQLQCKDLKSKLDELRDKLACNDLTPLEKTRALQNIQDLMKALEQEYYAAKKEHDANQLDIPAKDRTEFDPNGNIESEICRLGNLLDDIKRDVSHEATNPFYHATSTFSELTTSTRHQSSSDDNESNVNEKYDDLLKRYPVVHDDDTTTAPSMNVTTDDEITELQSYPGYNSMPQKYLGPTSSISKDEKSPTKSTKNSPSSKLPRLTNKGKITHTASEKRRPRSEASNADSSTGKQRPLHGEADSGFMGSESSRQSAAPTNTLADVSYISNRPIKTGIPVAKQRSPQIKKPLTKPVFSSQNRKPTATSDKPKQRENDEIIYGYGLESDTSFGEVSRSSTVKPPVRTDTVTNVAPPTHKHSKRPKSSSSKRSQTSSKKSSGSTHENGALNFLRDEIMNLRKEINDVKQQENKAPPTYKPIRNRDDDMLDSIMNEVKTLKNEMKKNQEPPMTSTPKPEVGRRHSDRSRGRKPSTRSYVTDRSRVTDRSASPTDRYRTPSRGRRGDNSSTRHHTDRSVSPHTARSGSRNRSGSRHRSASHHRSHSRNREKEPGYWTYVPPSSPYYSAPPVIEPPVIHHSPVMVSSPHRTYQPRGTAVPLVVQHDILPSPGRVYVPVKSAASPRIYQPATVMKPVYMSTPIPLVHAEVDVDAPLTRGDLYTSPNRRRSRRRSSSLPRQRGIPIDDRLNDSLERAERASDDLRSQSWSLYKTMRGALNKSEIMAGEF